VVFLILSFHFVNKNSCVVYFPHCLFLLTLVHTLVVYFRSQFHFSDFVVQKKQRKNNQEDYKNIKLQKQI
jgi:hypothetical protein